MPGPLQALVQSLGLGAPEAWRPTPVASHDPAVPFVGPVEAPRPASAWTKAASIGPARVGDRYLESATPSLLDLARSYLLGAARPPSIAAADPYGLTAMEQGAGPVPVMMGTTEPIGLDAVAAKLPRFANAIKAYHGSPHEFAPEVGAPLGKFKSAAIGTGEGAQAYGHGLYFAENEAVAKQYKDVLSRPEITARGVPLGRPARHAGGAAHGGADLTAAKASGKFTPAELDAIGFLGTDADLPTAIAELHGQAAQTWRSPEARALWTKRAETLEGLRDEITVKPTGKMYEVGIDADPDHLLDWDKPLKDQSPHVQKVLEDLGFVGWEPHERAKGSWNAREMSGQNIYKAVVEDAPTSYADKAPPLASQALRDKGIAGIKYLDGGSRQAGSGSRNFVIFDEQTIDILKKYGIAGLVGTGAAAGAAGAPGGSQ